MAKPKADRRPAAGQGVHGTTDAMLATLDKLSGALAAAVNHQRRHDRPVAGDQADRLAAAQHRRRGLADRLEPRLAEQVAPEARGRLPRNQQAAPHRPHGARWRLTASGMQLPPAISSAMRRDQDGLFRAALSRAARAAVDAGCSPAKKPDMTRQPVDPGCWSDAWRCRRRRRTCARRRQGPRPRSCARSRSVRLMQLRCSSARWRSPSAPR